MKKPFTLWIAVALLALRALSLLYMVAFGDLITRYRISFSAIAALFLGLAVLLVWKPRIGRWSAGIYLAFSALLGAAAFAKLEAPLKVRMVGLVTALVCTWLAHALLGGKQMKVYLAGSQPNQSTEPHSITTTVRPT